MKSRGLARQVIGPLASLDGVKASPHHRYDSCTHQEFFENCAAGMSDDMV